MENLKNRYMLVLERRPFDYMPINIGQLDIGSGINYNSMRDIDTFTKAFSKKDIIDSVKRSNLVTDEYLNGNMILIEIEDNNSKYLHKYPALTSDLTEDFDLVSFIYSNINDKNLMNSIIVKYSNLYHDDDMIAMIKDASNNKDTRSVLRFIYMMPYDKMRELYIYILTKLYTKEKSMARIKAA
jgi:hypothetical protein